MRWQAHYESNAFGQSINNNKQSKNSCAREVGLCVGKVTK